MTKRGAMEITNPTMKAAIVGQVRGNVGARNSSTVKCPIRHGRWLYSCMVSPIMMTVGASTPTLP